MDEAFARAFASWRAVSRHPAPAAWVVRTALNANISWWRRRRREVPVPDPGVIADPAVAGCTDSRVDPQILAALMRLPARQRQVVALRMFLDPDTAGTAAVLGVSALPGGTGVQLATSFTLLPPVTTNGGTQHVARTGVAIGLVYASPQWTG